MPALTIAPIPAFTDNYIWCLHDGETAVVVDPGDASPVRAFLQQHNLTLAGILVTHHHWDHVGGIESLVKEWTNIPVWGPAAEHIPCRTEALKQGDSVVLPFGFRFDVLEVPGHTLGHIAYYCEDWAGTGPVLLSGDTLFSSGCGRLFEGTAEQMHHSLGLFKRLPGATRVYCTHEYTQANLRFALAVEPDNPDILARQDQVTDLRAQECPSLPTTLSLELKVNPFLRVDKPSVQLAVARNCGSDPSGEVDIFAKLRSWKDHF